MFIYLFIFFFFFFFFFFFLKKYQYVKKLYDNINIYIYIIKITSAVFESSFSFLLVNSFILAITSSNGARLIF